MKAILTALICASVGLTVVAGDRMTAEEQAEYEAFGGLLRRPGTAKGQIVVVNGQQTVPEDVIRKTAERFETAVSYTVAFETGGFDLANPAIRGEASVFVIDDPKLPTLLLAPENRWCMMNVSKLGTAADAGVLQSRASKELIRALALLGGAFQSTYERTLMSCVTDPSQLDDCPSIDLPHDSKVGIARYLKGYGLLPFKTAYYCEACEQGWAPAPKDAVQREIWDKAHEIPSEPIKIKYQKPKGK